MEEQEEATRSSGSFTNLILVTAACLFTIWLLKFYWNRKKLYRLSTQIPGPPGFPIIGNALDFLGDSTEIIYQTILRYSTLYPGVYRFWIGPKLFISVGDPALLEIVCNSPQCLDKSEVYDFTKPYLGDGLLTASGDIWKKHRKMINPSFNQKVLDSYVEIFNEQTKILVEIMEKRAKDKDFDIFPLMSACLVDTICETAMGVKVNVQTTGNDFGKKQDRIMELAFIKMMSIWYHNEFIFNCMYKKETDMIIESLKKFAENVVVEKRKHFERRLKGLKAGEVVEDRQQSRSFLDLMLQLYHEKECLSDEELRDEVNNIMAAGSDTTATSVCFCLLMLGMYPEIQRKVYEEVMDILGEDRNVTAEDLPCLQYMDRVIKESLRVFSPVAFGARITTGDLNLGRFVVPENCNLVINIFHMHRDPNIWKDPFKFDPDRFLPEEVAKRHPYSYVPFSGGPRMCIGSKFAQMNMKVLMAIIVRKFSIKTEYKTIEEIKLKINILLRPTEGFKISLAARE